MTLPRGRYRFWTSFRQVCILHFLETGLRQPSFYYITRIPQRAVPDAWTRPPVSWHDIFPFTFRITGQPSDPETSPLAPGRYASDTTLRHVAQLQRVPPAPLIASTPTRSRHHAAFRAAIRHEYVQVA
jgi:hypothetical protein